jgi:hypothetical protein
MRTRLGTLLTLLAAAGGPALADPQATSSFVPVQVQDALVVRTGALTLQGTGVYTRDDHNSRGEDLLNLTPTLKLGPMKGVQLDVSVPYAVGNQSSASQGSAGLDAIYQFTDPTPTRPALAVQAGYRTPYGAGHKSAEYFARGLATQWLGPNDKSPRLHLNLDWTHVTTPSATGRRDILEIGGAYSMLLSEHVALVVDIVHGAKSTERQNQTIVDAGVNWELNDGWLLAGAAGAGIGQQSPAFRVIFAFQKGFQLF